MKIFARDNLLSKNPFACIWMQAGVVFLKDCRQDFNCTECKFDRALRRVSRENENLRKQGMTPSGKRGQIIFWKDKLRKRPPSKRPCIHTMRRHIDFKSCHHDYNCVDCDFDQYFNDQYKVYTVVRPVDLADIHGVHIPRGYYLHKGHTWAKIESDNEVRIGLDEFALKLLGCFDKIKAPLLGKPVGQGKHDIVGSRDNHTAAFASPVSGIVTALNSELFYNGSIANKNPYTDGWVMRVHCKTLRRDLQNLLFMDEAEAFLNKEIEKLYETLEQETGLMAADGGTLGDDIFGNAPGLEWDRLVRMFLRAS